MNKYSPGPWTAKPHRLMAAVPVIAGDGQLVATTSSGGTPDKTRRQTNIENARLIAAAPDLLAALQDVVDAYQKHFDAMPVAWQTYDNIARQAIEKATGN